MTSPTPAVAPTAGGPLQTIRRRVSFFEAAQNMIQQNRAAEIQLKSNPNKVNLAKDKANIRVEREMNLAHFKELLHIFRSADSSGRGSINQMQFAEAFGYILGEGLSEEQMKILFMKIDCNNDDEIDWDEFTSYMLLYSQGQKVMQEQSENHFFDTERSSGHPPVSLSTPHKDMILKIIHIQHMNRYITCSRDGTVCCWSDSLKLQRCYRNVDCKSRVESVVGTERPTGVETMVTKNRTGSKAASIIASRVHSKWILDALYAANLNKLILASDNHEISFIDQTTMEPQCRFDLQDHIPLCLDYWWNPENPEETESTLFFGNDNGQVCVIRFAHDKLFQQAASTKSKCVTYRMDHLSRNWDLGSVYRKKVHNGWTLKIRYFHEFRYVMSCSPDPKHSLVIGSVNLEGKWKFASTSVHKGVNTFAYCKFPICLVSGGTDRALRLWNPRRMSHPTALMKGHSSPIVDITINEHLGQIISLAVDKQVKVWDIRKQQCLQSVADSMQHRPENLISAMLFNPLGRLLVASTTITTYQMKDDVRNDRDPKSHEYTLRAAMYNSTFKQVVSGCDGSVVSVWDAITGTKTFQFSEVHENSSEITAMAFDAADRRLITGGRSGSIRIFNFNNGECVHELVKGDQTEVTGLCYIDMKESKFIVAAGWNRHITMFLDDPDTYKLVPWITWKDVGHRDDILSMAFCPPNLLATSSYDGEILITNLVSGHVLHRMVPDPILYANVLVGDTTPRSIDKVIFLVERARIDARCSLISSGTDGVLRFWNAKEGALLWSWDTCRQDSEEGIYAMCTDSANSILITANTRGQVSVWDIRSTCLWDIPSPEYVLPLVASWRGHVKSVVSVDYNEEYEMIVTASTDATVRVWTIEGHYVGTFGQHQPWLLGDVQTYKYPALPFDVAAALREEEYNQEETKQMRALKALMKQKCRRQVRKASRNNIVVPSDNGNDLVKKKETQDGGLSELDVKVVETSAGFIPNAAVTKSSTDLKKCLEVTGTMPSLPALPPIKSGPTPETPPRLGSQSDTPDMNQTESEQKQSTTGTGTGTGTGPVGGSSTTVNDSARPYLRPRSRPLLRNAKSPRYRTWYADSSFARKHSWRMTSRRESKLEKRTVRECRIDNIYHTLPAYELSDLSLPAAVTSIVNQRKKHSRI